MCAETERETERLREREREGDIVWEMEGCSYNKMKIHWHGLVGELRICKKGRDNYIVWSGKHDVKTWYEWEWSTQFLICCYINQ